MPFLRSAVSVTAALLLATSLPAATAHGGDSPETPSPSSVQGTRINFQLEGSEEVCGYEPDHGRTFDERNGLVYGWNFDHTDVARDREVNDDQLLDTLNHFHRYGKWEIEVPDGVHEVRVVIGDPEYGSRHTLFVEDVPYWVDTGLEANEFASETKTVAVSDGRLTLHQGWARDKATRINFVEIDAVGPAPGCGSEPTPEPTESPTPIETPTPVVSPTPSPSPTETPNPVRVNFQNFDAGVPCEYLPDYGETYGPRNGSTYGWNVDHTDVTRDRNIRKSQRRDTLTHIHEGGVWELAVADGTHRVKVSVGDPEYPSTHTINVEGVEFVDDLELEADEFKTVRKHVVVTDGKLTIDQGTANERATRINFVDVDVYEPRSCTSKSKPEPEPEPKPKPKPEPKPKPSAKPLPPRPYGRTGLKKVFGKHCNGRANDARTWYPSAGGRGKGGYVYYHSRLAQVVGRKIVHRINRRPGSADYGVWGYACRQKTGGTSWSVHSWGAAIDTNTLRNPYGQRRWNGRGSTGRNFHKYLPKAWMSRNFYWGLNFADPMHFQYVSGY